MTTLDGWLGSTKTTGRSLSPLLKQRTVERTVLGVLGTRSKVQYEAFMAEIVAPIIEAWGLPDELLVPAEGESSELLCGWARDRGIPVRRMACDWTSLGRKAGIFRDSAIQREATHLVLLQGPRSNAMTALAGRLQRKGRHQVVISERPGQPVAAPKVSPAKV